MAMLRTVSPHVLQTIRQKHHRISPEFCRIVRYVSGASIDREEIIVIGSGVVGLSSAHFLLSKSTIANGSERIPSCKVRLIDAFPHVAGGASRKNGGLLCPSLSSAWTAFPLFRGKGAIVPQMIKLGRADNSPISFDPKLLLDPRLWNFGLQWARRRAISSQQDEHIRAIMKHSMQCFDDQEDGIVRSVKFNRVALGTKTKEGKIAPEDSSGDIGSFCTGLAQELSRNYGEALTYHLGENVVGIQVKEGMATAVKTQRSDGAEILHEADKVVIAAGVGSYRICKELGVQCPVFPVKGYLVTFRSEVHVPYNIELSNKAFVSPLGNGLYRLSGFAEFTSDYEDGAHAMELKKQRIGALVDVAKEEFADLMVLDADCGYRPMSPDDAPIIGPTSKIPNVYLCTGHGSKGWTMGLGSGELLADLMLGNSPVIDPLPYHPSRFDLSSF